ncbi:hypothetical protein FPV67DRAFT_797318 [Lyophyllum atratum]|nr:hypothetical protein FPV67DRAFT_797318 [Lyophyllum atratum]
MMMLPAGDCSIRPLGRVYDDGKLCGIVMPLEMVIARRIPPTCSKAGYTPDFDSLPSPRRIIDALTKFLPRLHAKGVIHGDIKPSNILFCLSDGELRFCDFGCAGLESDTPLPPP